MMWRTHVHGNHPNRQADQDYAEVDRAIDNLVKSGKMFNMPGAGRRDSMPMVGASRTFPDQFGMHMLVRQSRCTLIFIFQILA